MKLIHTQVFDGPREALTPRRLFYFRWMPCDDVWFAMSAWSHLIAVMR